MLKKTGSYIGDDASEQKPKSHLRLYLFALALLLTGVVIIVLSQKWSGRQTIKSIEITGNRIIPSEEIQKQVGDSLLKTPNEKIKLDAIQKKLKNHPFIQETHVTHNNTEEIKIEIIERQPVAALVSNEGKISFVDEKGFTMPYRLFEKFADLPLVRNVFRGELIDQSVMAGAMTILRELGKTENRIIQIYISEIIYDQQTGEFFFLATDKQMKILFGRAEKVKEKIGNLLAYWNGFDPVSAKNNVKYIDLRWEGSIIAGFL